MATIIRDGEPLASFFAPVLSKIALDSHRERAIEVLEWVERTYPQLGWRIAWNQPMATDHGTFIIGFSYASKHMAVAGEGEIIGVFADELRERGISHGTKLFRLPWEQPVPYDFLATVIEYNIEQKKDVSTFWRP
ncbi:iron chaperone [Trueperella pecoris]|uniref:iron chaperone n=1 Tax=Trueperella pecoris TaxID=2733571 RepID=UPI00186B95EE|nr:DUF1801 domain-containing protein [Trueperella pecoris]QOQ38446.1 iron chaperone [Trueperella pecoris]